MRLITISLLLVVSACTDGFILKILGLGGRRGHGGHNSGGHYPPSHGGHGGWSGGGGGYGKGHGGGGSYGKGMAGLWRGMFGSHFGGGSSGGKFGRHGMRMLKSLFGGGKGGGGGRYRGKGGHKGGYRGHGGHGGGGGGFIVIKPVVSSSYGPPPSQGNTGYPQHHQGQTPSNSYGPPGHGHQHQHQNQIQPDTGYGAPGNNQVIQQQQHQHQHQIQPDTGYGAPGNNQVIQQQQHQHQHRIQPDTGYGAPGNNQVTQQQQHQHQHQNQHQRQNQPDTGYGAPGANQGSQHGGSGNGYVGSTIVTSSVIGQNNQNSGSDGTIITGTGFSNPPSISFHTIEAPNLGQDHQQIVSNSIDDSSVSDGGYSQTLSEPVEVTGQVITDSNGGFILDNTIDGGFIQNEVIDENSNIIDGGFIVDDDGSNIIRGGTIDGGIIDGGIIDGGVIDGGVIDGGTTIIGGNTPLQIGVNNEYGPPSDSQSNISSVFIRTKLPNIDQNGAPAIGDVGVAGK